MNIAWAVETSEELDKLEAHHLCPEKVLANLLAREQAPEPHSPGN
jgi:hypothetical protein